MLFCPRGSHSSLRTPVPGSSHSSGVRAEKSRCSSCWCLVVTQLGLKLSLPMPLESLPGRWLPPERGFLVSDGSVRFFLWVHWEGLCMSREQGWSTSPPQRVLRPHTSQFGALLQKYH